MTNYPEERTSIVHDYGPFYHEFKISKSISVVKSFNRLCRYERYIVERRTRIFNLIPLWWSFNWNRYRTDSVNRNNQMHETYEEAHVQMSRELDRDRYVKVTNTTIELGPEDKI